MRYKILIGTTEYIRECEGKSARVGRGSVVHLLSEHGKVVCGSGKVSTGSRRPSSIRPTTDTVTCAKCLERVVD